MKHSISLVASSAVIALTLGGPALSQGVQQTVPLIKINPETIFTTGYRTSKVVGSTVLNENNETVGTIDDLIITANENVTFAILSVSGFWGIGTKYVVVPYGSLQIRNNKMVLVGATKESLKQLPEFKYKD